MPETNKLSLFQLTFPLLIESTLRMLLGNVNVFMLGSYSDKAVGAIGVANQIIGIILMVYGITGTGTAITICQYLGAGQREVADKVASVAICFNLATGVLFSLVLVFFAKPVLRLMNLSDDLLEYAQVYVVIVGAASFTQAGIATMSGIIRSHGFTKYPMVVALGMNAVNIIGNYFSIFRPFGLPQLGVEGVAFSLVLSELLGLAAITVILFKKLGIRLRMKDYVPFPKQILKDILTVGAPGAGEYINYSLSQFVITYLVSFLGATALTTRVYLQNMTFFTNVLSLSIGQGTQILIGRKVGEGNVGEAYGMGIKSLKIAVFLNFTMSMLCLLFRRQLIGLFTKDAEIIVLASLLLCMDFLMETGRAFNHVAGNSLRGAGDVRYSMVISILSMWGVSVFFSFLFGIVFKFGMVGIWIAFSADEWCRGLLLLKRWRSRSWQRMAIVRNDGEAAESA